MVRYQRVDITKRENIGDQHFWIQVKKKWGVGGGQTNKNKRTTKQTDRQINKQRKEREKSEGEKLEESSA